MTTQSPVEHFLSDYQPLSFAIDDVFLTFELQPTATLVSNKMQMRALQAATQLWLDGEQLELLSVELDGEDITASCEVSEAGMSVPTAGKKEFVLLIRTRISPQDNTALEGLYRSSGNYCTQCEAEGFRKITYFFDRPDCLSLFTTKIIADKSANAVLLSNGNLIDSGDLDGNRHFAVWQDPFKKPCYLFALVAGDLACHQDRFIAADGREIDLRIYVEPKNIDKCEHAMQSLIRSMQWDEQRFGLVYDLDIYMIVAVDDFNMGAMENKGLNVFNSKFVLAKPDTATDVDYEGIEAVIAHEYFHNWTGNRVTCRDWFQLTLKEGLTVFRDQEFTADMLSPAVKRIEDVKALRNNQFPEDAGPMSHPIQPQSYIEMNNFYTMTVYEKGAEVVRLYHTLLGEQGFRQGMDLYFQRHDGDAVTVQDFRNAMADANHVDLSQMHNWYIQSGTPVVSVESHYNASEQTLTLNFRQRLNTGNEDFKPLLIPVRLALFDHSGQALVLKSKDPQLKLYADQNHEGLFEFNKPQQSLTFTEVSAQPLVSLFRGFSAPVIVEFDQSNQELALLAQCDTDSFVCWESIQTLALREIKRLVDSYAEKTNWMVSEAFTNAFSALVKDEKMDKALKALALSLPDLTYIGEQYEVINPDAIYHARKFLQQQLAQQNIEQWLKLYSELNQSTEYRYHKDDIAQRKLKTVCLQYLTQLDDYIELAEAQFDHADNMTDALASLQCLSHTDTAARKRALGDFYDKWQDDTLVLDKWFALQAASHHIHALEHVKQLVEHKDFVYTNPNRVRSVLGVFGRLNLLGLHRADGKGYQFLAEQVIKLDALNPQVAARMVGPFTHWQRYDGQRQQMMKQALEMILAQESLSKDVYEIASKSLRV
ncbi:aminopeptidase N [Thiomicrorhabdus sediminis]|uniref:Aminopeptidase N n=1 Tax=Thiomicrorhabdus sediminis TaxID=2580412 RepID=A0A4P9K625_9GAMM|nr:aminopeptidase N [Thiomicrorhabdus sediminis]QCU90504.1 aminopeptidase N [Thiomicrorhabdus sediminis]